MAADKTLFAPVPLRAMAADISGLLLRTLICVAAHDRMSLVTGKGQGCRASNERMAAMIGCSYARLCSTLTEAVDLGYLQREKLGRHTVYRVTYSDEDRLLFGNLSRAPKGCRTGSGSGVTGCQHSSETDGNPPETASQYIPLNGGIDLEESREENSSEEAHLAARDARRAQRDPTVGAQLAQFERAFRSDPTAVDIPLWRDWLQEVVDLGPDAGGTDYFRAERLLGDVDWWLDLTSDEPAAGAAR